MEFGRFERDDQRAGERNGRLRWQVVNTAALVGGQPEAEASQGDDLVTQTVEHVDRLPLTASCEARPDVQGVQSSHPDERFGRWQGRGRGRSVVRLPEQEAKRRARRGKGPRRPEREVDLEGILQEEDPVERRARPYVEVVDSIMIGVHVRRPVVRGHLGFEVRTDP